MSIKVVATGDGTVIREILPGGEQAYRITPFGQWHHSPDHKNRWVSVEPRAVPTRFLEALAEFDKGCPINIA